MLLPLRNNLLGLGQLAAAPEDQRIFLKRHPHGFVTSRGPWEPAETHWSRPYYPPPPPPLMPEYVGTVDELIARANARTDFTEEEQMMALLLIAA